MRLGVPTILGATIIIIHKKNVVKKPANKQLLYSVKLPIRMKAKLNT